MALCRHFGVCGNEKREKEKEEKSDKAPRTIRPTIVCSLERDRHTKDWNRANDLKFHRC